MAIVIFFCFFVAVFLFFHVRMAIDNDYNAMVPPVLVLL